MILQVDMHVTRYVAAPSIAQKSFTQTNDFVKQRVVASAAPRLVEIVFRLFRGFLSYTPKPHAQSLHFSREQGLTS